MKKEQIKKMIEIALSQLAYSYTPYSDFKVGAALLGKNGRIYTDAILKMRLIHRQTVRSVQRFLRQFMRGNVSLRQLRSMEMETIICIRAVSAGRSWQNSVSRKRFGFLSPKRMENISSTRLGNCFRVHLQRTI